MKNQPTTIKDYEAKRKELAKQKKQQNPEGRLTGYELLGMRNLIEGIRIDPDGNIRKAPGIGDIKKAPAIFKQKLFGNLNLIQDEIEVLNAYLPEVSEELKEKQDAFNEVKREIARRNANVPEDYQGAVSERMIEAAGNLVIYEMELARLEEEYKDTLDEITEINENREEILKQPLGKCAFDLISESEIPDEVSTNERLGIAAMIRDEAKKAGKKKSGKKGNKD